MLTVDLKEETQRALEERAAKSGHAVEDEAKAILEAAILWQQGKGLGSAIREIFLKSGHSLPDFVRDKTPIEPANFD